MTIVHIRPIKLRKWFPPNDPVAACVARLCILREDFILEFQGIYAEEIRELDGNSDNWRRMYFLRSSIRTLMEIRSAIENLQRQAEFRKTLSKQPKEKRKKFRELVKELAEGHNLVKDIRNAIAAHILQSRVQAALDEMDFDRWGFLEIGQQSKDTHYKFAGELLVAILMTGVPETLQESKLKNDFKTLANLFSVFTLIEDIFGMYVEERRLHKSA